LVGGCWGLSVSHGLGSLGSRLLRRSVVGFVVVSCFGHGRLGIGCCTRRSRWCDCLLDKCGCVGRWVYHFYLLLLAGVVRTRQWSSDKWRAFLICWLAVDCNPAVAFGHQQAVWQVSRRFAMSCPYPRCFPGHFLVLQPR